VDKLNLMKKFLLIALSFLLASALIGYLMFFKEHRDIAAENADFTITADELYAAYEADEKASNAKYLDKVIQISGKVVETKQNKEGLHKAVLEAKDAMIGGISVTMAKDKNQPLIKGENVTLKCRCTGKLMDVVLLNCSKQ